MQNSECRQMSACACILNSDSALANAVVLIAGGARAAICIRGSRSRASCWRACRTQGHVRGHGGGNRGARHSARGVSAGADSQRRAEGQVDRRAGARPGAAAAGRDRRRARPRQDAAVRGDWRRRLQLWSGGDAGGDAWHSHAADGAERHARRDQSFAGEIRQGGGGDLRADGVVLRQESVRHGQSGSSGVLRDTGGI